MLSRAMVVAGCLVVGVSCADDGGGASDLADRVRGVLESGGSSVADRLDQLGVDVSEAQLAGAVVDCPEVGDPAAGDRATCRVTVGDVDVELDIEFAEEGGIRVVNVAVAP